MIVRNEAAVIRRCLESVRPIIQHWVICDTGSSDQTAELIRNAFADIPGSLHSVPWVDFGHNRSIGMTLARGKADYHLLLDADMELVVQAEFKRNLKADAYLLRHEGDLDYWVERLVSDRHVWQFVGATHEFIRSQTARTREPLPGLTVRHHCDGSARRGKFERDIALLKADLARDPANARAVFYLAQSYRDLGNLAQALEGYEKRAGMGGWAEEAWYARYQVARLQHRLGWAWPLVLTAYLTAYESRPARLEPLLPIVRYYRETGQPGLGRLFGRPVVEARYPEDILFIERRLYEYELPIEYARCCSALTLAGEAKRMYARLLAVPTLPDRIRTLVENEARAMRNSASKG
jgi:glycosyltransferase involved in cell wall biosynthesis